MRGRNRLVPRLLGVTKESVLRLDEKTKEILKTWPLTTVRRWAASPNVFTLDFGDYQDQYYSVQTNEGEQISQLISGYIDIILKRRQKRDHLGDDGNDEEALEEEIVTPGRAIIMSGLPGVAGKKVDQNNVAKPGVLRNSGGTYKYIILHSLVCFSVFNFLFTFYFVFKGAATFERRENEMTNQFSSSRYPHADGGHAMNGVCFFSFIFLSVLFCHHDFSYISSFIFFRFILYQISLKICNQTFSSDP